MLANVFLALLVSTAYAQTQSLAPKVFLDIARCENQYRQYTDKGTLLISKTGDVGVMQISLKHKKEAEQKGFDITLPGGNIGYALYLYNREGTRPWDSSRACWSKQQGSS